MAPKKPLPTVIAPKKSERILELESQLTAARQEINRLNAALMEATSDDATLKRANVIRMRVRQANQLLDGLYHLQAQAEAGRITAIAWAAEASDHSSLYGHATSPNHPVSMTALIGSTLMLHKRIIRSSEEVFEKMAQLQGSSRDNEADVEEDE